MTSLLDPCVPGPTSYGSFSGFLGGGRMELLEHVAIDVLAFPCPRALDHLAPGDWTIVVRRDDGGTAIALHVGCWLARGLTYRRIG